MRLPRYNQQLFKIATEIEPLSKEDQLEEWLKFNKAMTILEDFYRNNRSLCQNVKLVHNFGYLSNSLISIFYEHSGSQKLTYIVRRGLKAKDTLISTNLRLIISLAKRFETDTMDLDYLIQEGTLGAVRSLVKFKPTSKDRVQKPKQIDLFNPTVDDTPEVIRHHKVSSYMRDWIVCYLRAAVSPQNHLIKTAVGKPTHTYVSFDPAILSTDLEKHLNPEIDFYTLVKQKPEDLEVLELSSMELALKEGTTVEDALKRKKTIQEEILRYLS